MGKSKTGSTPTAAAVREMQEMWLSLMGGSWSSIVVVPAGPETTAREVTSALIELAQLQTVDPFQIIDAAGAAPAHGERLARDLASVVASGLRAIVVVDSLMHSLGGVPLVRDADVALLVVRLGESDYDSVQSTIDIVGRERILGAVALPS